MWRETIFVKFGFSNVPIRTLFNNQNQFLPSIKMKKTILITGASRGIGYETAKYFLSNNHRVYVTARTTEKLLSLSNEFPKNCVTITADLSTDVGISTICNALNSDNARLDVLINNAGLLINKPFVESTRNDWQLQLECNLIGPALLIKNMVNHFNEGSHIINIGSMGGFQGSSKFPGLSSYSASKGALSILTECLAGELSNLKISVNCLCLGAVQTEMLADAFPGFQAPVLANQMGEYIGTFALDGQKFFNGKVLPVSLTDPN